MPSIDVIVPCYGYGHFLRQCVMSVLSQTGVDVRVLILDDASPDNTLEVATELAARDKRVTLVSHAVNRGHIATYNEGIDWADADYVLLLSADDYLLPEALQRATTLMDINNKVGLVFGRAIELSRDGSQEITEDFLDGARERIFTGSDFIELCGARNIVPTPTAVVRTSLQKRLGGYNPNLPHAGDMEMWLRLAANAAVAVVADAMAVYRRHSANMSLSYKLESPLPDIIQREAAFDYFMATEGGKLPDAGYIRHRVLRLLSVETLAHASAAFNRGELALCDELSAHAIRRFPGTEKTGAWTRLALKQMIGPSLWLTLQPLANKLRRRSAAS